MRCICSRSSTEARVWLVFAVLALGCCTLSLAQQTTALRLPWEQWQVHPGNDASCALPDSLTCRWQRANVDSVLIDSWHRIEVTLPAELQQTPQLALLMQGTDPIYEVFVNGTSIGASGSFATRRGPQDARTILSFPASLARNGHVTISVHMLGVDTSRRAGDFVPAIVSHAPFDQSFVVRDADTVSYLRRSWQHYLCYAALGGAGFVFFLLFAVNTRLREYAWLGTILGQLPLLRLAELAQVVNLNMPSWLGFTIFTVFNAIGAFIGIEFIFAFLNRPVPRLFRVVQLLGSLGLLQLLLLLPLPYSVFDPLASALEGPIPHAILIGAILIEAFAWLLLVPGCFKSRLPEMRAIGTAVLFLTFVEANRQAHNFGLPNIPQGFPWGDLDFDLRPLAYLVFSLVMLVAMTFRLRRIQGLNREIAQEMSAARSLQQILIPHRLPSVAGLSIESAYLPAQQVGGDFFQVLPLTGENAPDDSSAFIVVGDVSGKGLTAAMTVSLIVGTLRASAKHCARPADLLADLNRCLVGRGEGFTTCLALHLGPSGTVTIANAGHPHAYLEGAEIETEGNLPLGISFDAKYSETTVALDTGQRLTLVTDGVLEATHASSRELFGFARTQAISQQPAARIAEAARLFGQGAPQADDITVLTIARTGVTSSSMDVRTTVGI